MDYSIVDKDELIDIIEEKDVLIEALLEENRNQEELKFNWANNLGRWFWNVKNNKVQHNPRKVTALGYETSEIPSNIGFEFFTSKLHPDDYEYTMQAMRDHLSGKVDVYEVEYRIQAKDGNWKWYYDRGAITKRDKDGSPLLVAGIVFDITESKNIENRMREKNKQLEELNETKNRFIGMAAHDLRGPAGGLLGIMEYLEDEVNEKPLRELIEAGVESAKHMLDIIDYFLDISAIESGKMEMKIQQVEYIKLIEDVIKLEMRLAEKKDINITLDTELNEFNVDLDKGKVKQVVINLINNAVKYSPKKSTIQVRVEIFKNHLVTSISDNGPGIDKEDMEKLFQPFSRTKNQPTGGEKSTGLGLFIAKKIIETHKGDIGVRSNSKHGSTFYFRIPLGK